MDKVKLKEGDILTVQTEAISSAYDGGEDFEKIVVETTGDVTGVGDIEELFEKDIYRIVKNKAHEDLVAVGGNSCYYSIEGEPIESFSRPKKGFLRINGEYDVPTTASVVDTPLHKLYFIDSVRAQRIATTLNKVELKRIKKLQTVLDKVAIMLEQIVEGKNV